MLKKYTKYIATAFAVASLSTFIIGCGDTEESTASETPMEMPEGEGDPTNSAPKDIPDPADPENPSTG